jgi:hypothetical protein
MRRNDGRKIPEQVHRTAPRTNRPSREARINAASDQTRPVSAGSGPCTLIWDKAVSAESSVEIPAAKSAAMIRP